MLVTVVETPAYLAKASKFMQAEEMSAVVLSVASNPLAGDVIKGTGGLRKVRFGLEGRGKRGGARVIYWFYNANYPAVLLWAFAKNEASDLYAKQRKALAKAADGLRESFERRK